MTKLILHIYDYFTHHRISLWCTMICSVVVFVALSLLLQFQTQITDFMPNNQEVEMLDKLKIKDKLIIMFQGEDVDELVQFADAFDSLIWQKTDTAHIAQFQGRTDLTQIAATTNFIYHNLPYLLQDSDYDSLASFFTQQRIDSIMADNYAQLTSPFAMGVQDYITKDPVGLASTQLSKLQKFNEFNQYSIYDGYLCSADNSILFNFIVPTDGSNASQLNDELITAINQCFEELSSTYNGVKPYYYGAPAIAVYNARQIKRDLIITMNVALLLIIILVFCAFQRKRTLALLVAPVAFGVLFSLACIALIQGHISAIAIGTGSVVLGVALSYSIHFIAHAEHCKSPRQLVKELTYPLVVGSLTTIGAFIGLLFTSSPLLHDFGLFAAFALIGTMLFCLIFLPHFLVCNQNNNSVLLKWFNRLSSIHLDHKWWAISFVVVVFVVSLFFCSDVAFDYDMMHLNYMPKHIKEAEQLLSDNGFEDGSVLLVVSGKDVNNTIDNYCSINEILSHTAQHDNKLHSMSIVDFVINDSIQQSRLAKWNQFFSLQKCSEISLMINKAAVNAGFESGSFVDFDNWISQDFSTHNIPQEIIDCNLLFSNFIEYDNDSNVMLLTQLWIDNEARDELYPQIENYASIIDNSYYIGKFSETVNDDFNYILWMSTLLIFIVLLLSYRRFELALLAFTPMLISWIMILGVMALLHIDFNIVNIILSTFIFGIGDDFSIFVLDGLMNERKNGREMFAAHKVAIFFSAITTIIGMGALLFAKHPAIYSLSVVSLVGIVVVVLLATILLPALYRLLVADVSNHNKMPHTLLNSVRTVFGFGCFGLGCIVSWGVIIILLIIPSRWSWKRKIMNKWITFVCRLTLKTAFGIKYYQRLNGYTFQQPAIVVANHQSFVDLLLLKSIDWRIIFVSKNYILNNPLVGFAARFAGFLHNDNEKILKTFKDRIDEGYSVLMFPEGTRSRDNMIHRFHKGAFALAQHYQVDIVAISVYGTDLMLSPHQLNVINPCCLVAEIIRRFTPQDDCYQLDTRMMSEFFRNIIRDKSEELKAEFNSQNRYFVDLLNNKYLYKDTELSGSVRWLLKVDKGYEGMQRVVQNHNSIAVVNSGNGLIPFALHCYSPSKNIIGYEQDEDLLALSNHITIDGVKFYPLSTDIIDNADVYIVNTQTLDIEQQVTEIIDKMQKGARLIINFTPQMSIKQRFSYLFNHRREYIIPSTEWINKLGLESVTFGKDDTFSTTIILEK